MAVEEQARREGQEGSRWINVRPTGEQLADWFKDNVKIDESLDHKDYVSGVTLIPQTEKAKEVIGWNPEQQPMIAERTNLVYIPYAKVETRVNYFWDLMAAYKSEWLGVIEPVDLGQGDAKGLPTGFFRLKFTGTDNKEYAYVCCSMKVTVYERETVEWEAHRFNTGRDQIVKRVRKGKTVIDAPPATKMIATLGYNGKPDQHSLMKAETGAVGRALGMAGMLVIPGTGVATAEDVMEAQQQEGRDQAATPEAVEAPQEARSQAEIVTELRQRAAAGIAKLKEEHPNAHKAFMEWAKSRSFGRLNEIADERILRGLVTKVEASIAEAEGEGEEVAEVASEA